MAGVFTIEQARAALEQALINEDLPTPLEPVVLVHQAGGWEFRFLPASMSPGEYASVFIKDFTDWWDIHDLGASIEGEHVPISIGDENEGAYWGPALYCGDKDEQHDYVPVEDRKWDWVGGPHGHVTLDGMDIYVNGAGPGVASSPVGTVIRCREALLVTASTMSIPFTTDEMGTLELNIRVSPEGVRVFANPTFTNSEARCTVIHPAMIVVTTPDIYEDDERTIDIGVEEDPGDSANLGPITEYRFKWSERENLVCKVILPRGGTGPGINDWDEAVVSQAMLQKREQATGSDYAVRKLYLYRFYPTAPGIPETGASDVLIRIEKT